MKSSTHELSITVKSPGRQHDEEWETVMPREIAFWKMGVVTLASRNYCHNDNVVVVGVNWKPLVSMMTRDYKLEVQASTGRVSHEDWFAKRAKPLRLKAICTVTGPEALSPFSGYSHFFVEYFLYEIFLIANLALPGSAEFLNFQVEWEEGSERLRLSAFYFSEWMIRTIEGKSPGAKILNLDQTIEWFNRVNPHVTQKAENSTQKALYSTYQLCRSDGQIDFVLWLFKALESLLNTKVGENFGAIVRRTNALLELNEKQQDHCKKTLRKLYDLRSSFIHGGYEVLHPLNMSSIDPRLDDDYSKILEISIEGFGILVALLQALIEKEIPIAVFEERVVARSTP
jgi:Apea-like HEPN